MSVLQIGLLLLASFFLMLALSVPVSISLIVSSLVTVSAALPIDLSTFVACQKMVSGVDSFSLLAVPFFILTGVLLNTGGIAQRLINLAKAFVGRIPGGLAHTNIVGNTMFGALSVVLGYYSFKITPNLKIGFGSIPNMLVDYLFGPVVGGLFGGAMDVIKFMLKPDGGFMPGFTFNAMLAAFIYGLFFYKKNLSLPRILTAKLVVIVLCNIVLGTYWLTLLNGKGFLAILPARAIKNLIQWPVDSLIFFLVAKTLEQAGVFKLILHAGNRQRR